MSIPGAQVKHTLDPDTAALLTAVATPVIQVLQDIATELKRFNDFQENSRHSLKVEDLVMTPTISPTTSKCPAGHVGCLVCKG